MHQKKNGFVIVSVPYMERLSTKARVSWGHMHSFDTSAIKSLFPKGYKLISKKRLPNILLSLPFFGFMPLKVWLILNDVFGLFFGGYWTILRFKRIG